MKKRILSILLCFCMALTILPTAAFAAEGEDISKISVATDSNAGTTLGESGQPVTEQERYTVTYDPNGGTGTAPVESCKAEGENFMAADNSFAAPEGKQFKEWNTAADVTGTVYAPGDEITMPAGDLTLYAIWEDNPLVQPSKMSALLASDVTNSNYEFDSATGTLTIKTNAATAYSKPDYNYGPDNWRKDSSFSKDDIQAVIIENSVTSIGDYAFATCRSLTSFTLPDSVTYIGNEAFYGCGSLTSITIPDSVTYIGYTAFAYCDSLTSIILPDSVISIEVRAFNGCSGLTSITIPDSVTSIGDSAFAECSGLTSIILPDSVTSIGDYAFAECSGLTSITLPDSVTSIGRETFNCCSSLTSITIPDSVTSIGRYAFAGCSGLTSISIPAGVTSIGDSAFAECSSLTSITLPDSLDYIGGGAFYCCGSLTSITIPDSVTYIGYTAFAYCDSLTSISISSGVTSIEDYVFNGCSGLTSITIPDSVTSIGDFTFAECSGLTSIILPDSVTSIGDYAFAYCDGLTSISIPAGVTSIDTYAFADCSSLISITFSGSTPPSFGPDMFYDVPAGLQLIVPYGAASSYETALAGILPAGAAIEEMVNHYTVTYDENGGTGTMANGTATQGVPFTLPANGFTAPGGKQFKEWAIGSTSGTKVAASGSFTFIADTTVYAVWEDISVTGITVTGTGGASSVQAGSTLQMLADVSPTNAADRSVTWSVYGNNSASTSISGGLLTVGFDETASTVTVRATSTLDNGKFGEFTVTVTRSAPTTYTVTVVNGTGDGNFAQGAVVSISANTAPSGKTFDKWVSSDGVVFVNGNSASTTFQMPGKAVTVTATYKDLDNGGGTSGGGGGGYTPSTPPASTVVTEKQPDMPTTAKQSVSGTVKDNVLTATITEQMVMDAIKAAQDAAKKSGKEVDGIAVEFGITGSGSYTSLNVTIDAGAIDRLKEAGVQFIKIGSAVLDITLDTGSIAEIDRQSAGTVTVSAGVRTKLSTAAKRLIGNRPVFDITVGYQKSGKTEHITDFGKGAVTLGIAYKAAANEATGSLFGVYVDKNGKPQFLTNSSYTDGKLMFSRNSLSTYGVGYKAPVPVFTDTAKHWAKDNIDFVVSRGLIAGVSATTFAPNTAITRADFLMALGKLSGADVSIYKTGSFIDVKTTDTAMPYIEWAVKNKIVSGYGNGKFGPNNSITREQMAVMMVNYAKATGYTLPVSRQAVIFADDAKISSWAKDAVKAIQQTGIIVGKNNNLFDPQGNATRGEASTNLRRFVELVIDEGAAHGWSQNDAGQWQYIGENGKAVTGWLDVDSKRYYFTKEGIMVSGKWLELDGKWYYFYADGSLAQNAKVDGYEVDANGVRKTK